MGENDLGTSALAAEEVIEGLKTVYRKTVLPLERDFKYDMYFSGPLQDVDFDSKPIVLVLGQYSTGKTTFIKHLIGRDFPGLRIGPEPTSDKFTCVYYGPTDQTMPGTVLCNDPELPFKPLEQFGNHFLNKFEGSACASNTLKSFMFVDTPGVLSGKKQRTRQYPYEKCVEWFAEKAVRILLLFDGSKLDISDEFKAVIGDLRKHDEKIRIILNKSDSISEKELIRVYGALMWNLGKVFKTPEVLRVYISSFHDKPLNQDNFLYQLFKGEAADLIGELKALPRQGAMQKVNEILKRMRLVKTHAKILSELRNNLPKFFGKRKKQKAIIEQLAEQFRSIARKTGVPKGDFPNLDKFKEVLMTDDLSKYPNVKQSKKKFEKLDASMSKVIPKLVKRLNDRTKELTAEELEERNYNPFTRKNFNKENGTTGDSDTLSSPEDDAFNDILKEDGGSVRRSTLRRRRYSAGMSTMAPTASSVMPRDDDRGSVKHQSSVRSIFGRSTMRRKKFGDNQSVIGSVAGSVQQPTQPMRSGASRISKRDPMAVASVNEGTQIVGPDSTTQSVINANSLQNNTASRAASRVSKIRARPGAITSQPSRNNVPSMMEEVDKDEEKSRDSDENPLNDPLLSDDRTFGRSFKSRLSNKRPQFPEMQRGFPAPIPPTGPKLMPGQVDIMTTGNGVKRNNRRQVYSVTLSPTQNQNQRPQSYVSYAEPTVFEDDEVESVRPMTVLAHRMPRKDSASGQDWVVGLVDKTEADNVFYQQNLVNNKLTGASAKKAFQHLRLPRNILNKIWVLVDFDKTNELDADQFALAVWLGKNSKNGVPLPPELTWEMIPPSYRDM